MTNKEKRKSIGLRKFTEDEIRERNENLVQEKFKSIEICKALKEASKFRSESDSLIKESEPKIKDNKLIQNNQHKIPDAYILDSKIKRIKKRFIGID